MFTPFSDCFSNQIERSIYAFTVDGGGSANRFLILIMSIALTPASRSAASSSSNATVVRIAIEPATAWTTASAKPSPCKHSMTTVGQYVNVAADASVDGATAEHNT